MITVRTSTIFASIVALAAAACSGGGGGNSNPGGQTPETVSIVRDVFGSPHVFAQSDGGAYFGAGYAAAEDRLFQMCWTRLMYQGRVAEFLGPGTVGSLDLHVAHDVEARLFGWALHAERAAAAMDPAARKLLDAYAAGVNAYMKTPGAALHPFFAQFGVPLEPWTAADCIGVWLRLGRHFGNNGLGEAKLLHQWQVLLADPTLTQQERLDLLLGPRVCDDEAAHVQQTDVPLNEQMALAAYAQQHGLLGVDPNCTPPVDSPHFSQAWVASGARTTTGRAVLAGDPRLELSVPGALYEWSMECASFSVRGAGVAGSPNLLSGSSEQIAWSPTASGLDQADLFLLSTDPVGHPGQYRLDGVWTDFTDVRNELVLVAGAPSQNVACRSSLFGPVVTAIVKDVHAGEEYSIRRVPLDDVTRDSTTGFAALYRAQDADACFAALSGWRFPSANVLFADSSGRIGYALVGDIPVRPPSLELAGVIAQDGAQSSSNWLELLPHALRPHVFDPAQGFLASANQRPVGSWFPVPILMGSFSAGDTARSRRMRELFNASPTPMTPLEVEAFHADIVHCARRDTAELGLWLRDNGFASSLAPQSLQALAQLAPWQQAGAKLDGLTPGSVLATQIDVGFRRDTASDALLARYGGGENGLNLMLKTIIAGIHSVPAVAPGAEERAWVDTVLRDAWDTLSAVGAPASWPSWYLVNARTVSLEEWTSLEGLPSLAPGATVAGGVLRAVDEQTMLSPLSTVYTQFTSPGDGDGARSMLPVGASELAGAHQLDQLSLWSDEMFKSSPRTAGGIASMGPSTLLELEFQP